MALNPDWKEFIELLNSNKVEYVIVGAFALAFHGRPRLTGDIDFFVRNSPENAARIIAAIEEFGFKSLGLKANDFVLDDQIVQLGFPPRRIDVITQIDGVSFDQAWSSRLTGAIQGVPIFIISREDLLINKRASGRPKDIADVDALENQ